MAKNMVVQAKDTQPKLNGLKWLLIALLLAAGIAGNYYFNKTPAAILAIGWLILTCILVGIASLTRQGQSALDFAKEARIELRKVVWPSRQETVNTTLIVIALVMVVALILWGVDSILLWAIGLITGQ
jgi:preprotein translocase subunit SecE